MDADDAKELVRRGYDALSFHYDRAYAGGTKYGRWLGELCARLPAGGSVLDLGCGSGTAARTLVDAGFRVTGVDISEVQIRRARALVPQAEFVHADAAAVDFEPASFDATVAFYSLIHIPLAEQLPLLRKVAAWLRPGGWFLGTTGHHAWTGTDDDWLGGGTSMWWSHADADTYRTWLADAGLTVEQREFVPEGASGHALFRARRARP